MTLNELKEKLYKRAPHWYEIIEKKENLFTNSNLDLSDIKIIVHNGTWCSDCEREVTELLALCNVLKNNTPTFKLFEYEDKNLYIEQKKNDTLSVSCIPTIIFFKDNIQVGKVEECSNMSLPVIIKSLVK